jgi:hypothetical protein
MGYSGTTLFPGHHTGNYVSCWSNITNCKELDISDSPFIVGHVEDELSLVISTKILSIAVLESF